LSSLSVRAKGFNESSCIRFCNEPLPVYENHVVNYFQTALRHTASMPLNQIIPRAEKFFEVIDPILKQYQVPLDFKYLCVVESALNAKAMSHKGAYGYWQFMPHTARAMGLIVNANTDEREDLVKSTHAACKYFLRLYNRLGTWSLAAAAYNAGPTKVQKYLKSHGKTSYYNLRISAENRRYLYRVLAAKELFTRPGMYASVIAEEISLSKFFQLYGISKGLIAPPKIKVKPSDESELEITATESSLDKALMTGFDDLIALSFKRKGSFRVSFKHQNTSLKLAQNTEKPVRLMWWRDLRVNNRRRNDLKGLLTEDRTSQIAKKQSKSRLA